MTAKTRLSLDAFLAMPDIDERRLELIDGEVYEKVSPRWGHSRIAVRLGSLLDRYGYAGGEPRAIIPESGDRGPSAPLPDLAFYREDPPGDDQWMTRPPDVAVEILSLQQSRLEMRSKVDLYISFGVKSVWVVDLERSLVDVYENGERRTLSGDDILGSDAVPGLLITINDLLRRPD